MYIFLHHTTYRIWVFCIFPVVIVSIFHLIEFPNCYCLDYISNNYNIIFLTNPLLNRNTSSSYKQLRLQWCLPWQICHFTNWGLLLYARHWNYIKKKKNNLCPQRISDQVEEIGLFSNLFHCLFSLVHYTYKHRL